jgi:preprotein translocase subunit SecA
MANVLTKILGDPNEREIKRTQGLVDQINGYEERLSKLSDDEIKAQTTKFKAALTNGSSLDDLLPEAFATVREVSKRVLGMRHYDVQMIGGIMLHRGRIAEMRTGEGKTLVATTPTYLNALTGKGVHVVTVNDYLVRRDAGWMAQVYSALGLTTGIIVPDASFGVPAYMYDPEFTDSEATDPRLAHLRPCSRQEAYAADITHGTNNEFGFDFLRDNMVDSVERMVQRELNFAIVDEVDSILIDEARTPLIISAPADEATDQYMRFAQIAKGLKADEHYTIDEKMKAVSLTDAGVVEIERILGVDNVYEAGRIEDVHHIEQSLRAEAMYSLDKDYVVRDNEIIIVDEFTGRLMPGRRWSEGLHQAVEAKEKVEIKQESLTLATITFQNYFRLYKKLAGMTGTALTESEEFHKIYDLGVVTIPTNRSTIRKDLSDRIYKTEAGKFRAVARSVAELNAKGQPVLIGTVSIAKNELLSRFLHELGVPHQILNAKNNEAEASIISNAGAKGAVTLATNIAGRGTDIVLAEGVAELGGLHVLGTERHESRRIDNQLRGRSGRQGDPGSTQFYVSLEDDLMRIFGSERLAGVMTSLGLDEDTPIENGIVSRSLESAQKKVEGYNFDTRKQLVEYDDVMNRHREVVYSRRRKALEAGRMRDEIVEMVGKQFEAMVKAHTDPRTGEVDGDALHAAVETVLPHDESLHAILDKSHPSELAEALTDEAGRLYDFREGQYGEEGMTLLERLTYINVLDRLWIEHLEAMDNLRSGIGLRAIGQRDPLIEYKREGFRMFQQLIGFLEGEIAATIFRVSLTREPQEAMPIETVLTRAAEQASTNSVDGVSASSVSRAERRSKPQVIGQPKATKSVKKKKRR